ncbi:MAG TPA: DNA polymerase III subunit epsilon [Alphaproteobacteria bacterium]|nr:DNA polymerase III subunit epsilon [Alphaproteobacteria bacterium]
MREIVLDTETTGLDPQAGHRVVEIACIELINRIPSGRQYQTYVNPERDMPEEAFRVHGLGAEFLSQFPVFSGVADDFLDFIEGGALVIHNAEFDLGFLNAELALMGRQALQGFDVVDTVALARQKFPGAPASLDALCRRFGIDNSGRDLHGALLDAQLLADVYLELMGGRQPGLRLGADEGERGLGARVERPVRPARPHAATAEELEAHGAFLSSMANAIWNK